MAMRLFNTFIVICLLFGCNSKESKSYRGQEISINIGSEPQSLDIRKARHITDYALIHMLFEGLVKISTTDQIKFGVAEKIEVSLDQRIYTFYLRECYWSNGDKVTANDFINSWKQALDPSFPSPMAFQLYVIKNAKSIKEGVLSGEDLAVKAPDEKTLVIELENSIPYFIDLLTMPIFFPINSKSEELKGDELITNGPFIIEKWKHHDEIVLKKSPCYWNKNTIRLEKIQLLMVSPEVEYAMYEKGMLHWIGSPLSTIPIERINETTDTKVAPFCGTSFLRINTKKFDKDCDYFNNFIRKALAYAINRQEIIEHVLQGKQLLANTLVPSDMNLHSSLINIDNDLDKAKMMLEKGIREINVSKTPTFSLLYFNSERNHLIVQVLQRQWKEIGIDIQLVAAEKNAYFQRIRDKDYDLSLCNWLADYIDPLAFLEVFEKKDNGVNNTEWENQDYIDLLTKSKKCSDFNERREILAKAEDILIDEMPIIPLTHMRMIYLKKNNLKNVELSSLGLIDFTNAYFDEDGSKR